MYKIIFLIFLGSLMVNSSPLIPRNIPINIDPIADPADYRLPGSVIPLNYSIDLVVDPNSDDYYGETKIRIKVLNNTNIMILHANRLNITNYAIKDQLGTDVPIFNITRSTSDNHFLIIELENDLMKDQIFELEFRHESLFGELSGLYKSSYLDSNGTKIYLAVTQLGLTSAREVFPCFDEPALKTTFDVRISSPEKYEVISNMDVIETTSNSGYKQTSFRSTPLMSTYLLAFVISDFEYKSNTNDGPIIYPKEFRIYAKPTAKNSLDFALEMGQKNMQFLQSFIDVPYRLPKIDNVAVPDFSFGAMENWGVITYREDNLIYSKQDPSTQSEYRINLLMAHEIAHFWFGDEVTPAWWDYTWMKEGFATYFEQYVTDNTADGWRVMEQFVATRMHGVMYEDSLPSTNPMTNSVVTPNEILRNLNSIAYTKAACVIRMMQHILGELTFRFALSTYVKSLPTGVTEPKILFDEMQKVVGPTNILPENITVEDIFGSWSNQAGYPIIYAERITNSSKVMVQQKRYYQDDSLSTNETWWVPLTWTTDSNSNYSNTTTQMWLKPTDSSIEISIDPIEDWFIFNKQQTGYYRVMYDLTNWKKLIQALNGENHIKFHPLNKAQLIDDAYTFSLNGHLEYEIVFDLLSYLSNETDWIPWITADRVIDTFNTLLPASKLYNLYEAFKRNITTKVFDLVSLQVGANDTYVTKRLRSLVSNIACGSGVVECRNTAENILRNYLENGIKVHNDLKYSVYCGGLQSGDKELWNGLFEKYQNENETSERDILIQSLGCTTNKEIIDEYLLEIISDDSLIREEDVELAVFYIIYARNIGIERTLLFLNGEFLKLRERLSSNPYGTTRIILILGLLCVTDDNMSLFHTFIDYHSIIFFEEEREAARNAWKALNQNKQWIAENMYSINKWLLENYSR